MIKNPLPASHAGQYSPIRRPLKKGEDCAPALWLCASVDYSSGVSDFLRRWRRFISPCIDVMINCEVLSPDSFTSSIASTISCGTRDFKDCDFALVVPVAITKPSTNGWATVYTNKKQIKALTWATPITYSGPHFDCCNSQKTRPGSVTSTNRASHHNVTEAYTMAGTQHTQTHPKYQYRFMALLRADVTASPCRLTIEATSEQEARQQLSGDYILSFAGRIPAQEVRHA